MTINGYNDHDGEHRATFDQRIWPVIDVYGRLRRLVERDQCRAGQVHLLADRRAAIA